MLNAIAGYFQSSLGVLLLFRMGAFEIRQLLSPGCLQRLHFLLKAPHRFLHARTILLRTARCVEPRIFLGQLLQPLLVRSDFSIERILLGGSLVRSLSLQGFDELLRFSPQLLRPLLLALFG